MSASALKDAVATYVDREPDWMRQGNDPKALMENVAGEYGISYADLRDAILDHFTPLGAG